MENKVNYALVGAFVLALGAALVAGVLWLSAGITAQKRYEPYQAIFDESVAGLNIDAPVRYLGVDVGKVREIGINPQNTRQVRLLLLIERGTPIHSDTEAMLKAQGLTGIANIELSGGSPSSAPLAPAADGEIPTIRSRPSLVTRLEADVATVLANLNRTSTAVTAALDADNRAALKRVLADTATLVQALAAQHDAISSGIANASRAAGNVARASERLTPAVEKLGPALERVAAGADAVERMAVEVGLAGRGVDAAASGVRQLSTETLPEIERLLAELNRLATSLRKLSEQTEHDPASLLRGTPALPAGPGERSRP